MTTLINFLNTLNEETSVIYSDKYGNKISSLNNLKEVVAYNDGALIKNFSLLSGRILAAGRLYKLIYYGNDTRYKIQKSAR